VSQKAFPTPGAVPARSVVLGTWPGLFGLGQRGVACHLGRVTWLLLGRGQPSPGPEESPRRAEVVWNPGVKEPELIPSWVRSLPGGR